MAMTDEAASLLEREEDLPEDGSLNSARSVRRAFPGRLPPSRTWIFVVASGLGLSGIVAFGCLGRASNSGTGFLSVGTGIDEVSSASEQVAVAEGSGSAGSDAGVEPQQSGGESSHSTDTDADAGDEDFEFEEQGPAEKLGHAVDKAMQVQRRSLDSLWMSASNEMAVFGGVFGGAFGHGVEEPIQAPTKRSGAAVTEAPTTTLAASESKAPTTTIAAATTKVPTTTVAATTTKATTTTVPVSTTRDSVEEPVFHHDVATGSANKSSTAKSAQAHAAIFHHSAPSGHDRTNADHKPSMAASPSSSTRAMTTTEVATTTTDVATRTTEVATTTTEVPSTTTEVATTTKELATTTSEVASTTSTTEFTSTPTRIGTSQTTRTETTKHTHRWFQHPKPASQSQEEFKESFDFFDLDSSGTIGSHELEAARKSMGFNHSEGSAEKVVATFDKDGDGGLDLSEFSKMAITSLRQDKENKLRQAFELFADKTTKKISVSKLTGVITGFNMHISEKDVHDMVAAADRSGDGVVDEEEFLRIVDASPLF